jgi:hypothetical protein
LYVVILVSECLDNWKVFIVNEEDTELLRIHRRSWRDGPYPASRLDTPARGGGMSRIATRPRYVIGAERRQT